MSMRFIINGLVIFTSLGVRVEVGYSDSGDYILLYDGKDFGAGVISCSSGWYEIGHELYIEEKGRSYPAGFGVVENAVKFIGRDSYGVL